MSQQPTALKLANLALDQSPFGTGLAFPLVVDPATKDLKTITGLDGIKQNIQVIVLVSVGVLPGMEDFGTSAALLTNLEPVQGVLDVIPSEIQQAVYRYEPRVAQVSVKADEIPNGVKITISWRSRRVAGFSTNGVITLTKFLDETNSKFPGWQIA